MRGSSSEEEEKQFPERGFFAFFQFFDYGVLLQLLYSGDMAAIAERPMGPTYLRMQINNLRQVVAAS